MVEDLALEPVQLRPWFNSELFAQENSGRAVELERVRLSTSQVERTHQLLTWPLPERPSPDQRLELGDRLGDAAVGDRRLALVDPHLVTQALQPPDLGLCEGVESKIRERLAPPERKRLPPSSFCRQSCEAVAVEFSWLEADPVPS